jgi:hypothetical protein
VDPLQDLYLEGKEAPVSKLSGLIDEMRAEFPDFKLVPKDESKFMKFLAVVTKPWCPDFMTSYATAVGATVYHPRDWSDWSMYEVLRHERIHIRDHKKWKLLYSLSYLFTLPVVVTMRAFWEFRAYCETLKVAWERRGKPRDAFGNPVVYRDIEWAVSQFTGAGYLFMFPFPKTLRGAFLKASRKWV